ncbi:MAG: hypothetical protein ACLGSD_12515 [Acidobacteriota bacterium]
MKAILPIVAAGLAVAALAQAPPASRTFHNPLGFSYAIPPDWETVDYSAQAKEQARQGATTEDAKKGLQCVQMGLMARHGSPSSVIVEVALPFECFGQTMTNADLPGFAAGASQGLRQNFDLGAPTLGEYTLGKHDFWIERASGTMKQNPSATYTVEIACTVAQKAAVCWMTMAADPLALSAFESGMVSLDGEPPAPLVPGNAFDKKPS